MSAIEATLDKRDEERKHAETRKSIAAFIESRTAK